MACHPAWEFPRILASRGRRSRNKVSVGEPADGSLESTLNKSTLLLFSYYVGNAIFLRNAVQWMSRIN